MVFKKHKNSIVAVRLVISSLEILKFFVINLLIKYRGPNSPDIFENNPSEDIGTEQTLEEPAALVVNVELIAEPRS